MQEYVTELEAYLNLPVRFETDKCPSEDIPDNLPVSVRSSNLTKVGNVTYGTVLRIVKFKNYVSVREINMVKLA